VKAVVAKSEELIRELIERVAGDIGLIIYALNINGEFTDEEIAMKLGVEINDVRRALFALYELGLAEYRRQKDEDTGWMEYYWKINYDRQKEVLRRELMKTKRKLEEKIEQEDNTVYYICINGCLKASYEQAIEMGFTCPRCSSPLEYLDNTMAIEKVREELNKIDELLKEII